MITSVGYEPTDEWLEQINDEFTRKGVSHKQRPWDAWMRWCAHTGVSSSLRDADVKWIFDWFEENTMTDSQMMGPIYLGAFYYDSCFWPISIPVISGERTLAIDKFLKTMPDPIKTRLMRDREAFGAYMDLF